jgi:hypothetical protein
MESLPNGVLWTTQGLAVTAKWARFRSSLKQRPKTTETGRSARPVKLLQGASRQDAKKSADLGWGTIGRVSRVEARHVLP